MVTLRFPSARRRVNTHPEMPERALPTKSVDCSAISCSSSTCASCNHAPHPISKYVDIYDRVGGCGWEVG